MPGERFYEQIGELDAIVWEADPETRRLTNVSAQIVRLLGYTVEQALRESDFFSGITHPEDRDKIPTLFELVAEGAERQELEFRALTADGRTVWLRNCVRVLRDAGGGVRAVRGLLTDVTAHRSEMERLRREVERLRRAVEGSHDGLWEWDAASGRVWQSAQCRHLLGYEEDEPTGTLREWASRLHPEDRKWVLKAGREHLEHGIPYDVEYRLRTRRGEYRWFRARGQAQRDETGKAVRMSGSIRNFTDRKEAERIAEELEKQLRHAQKMEAVGQLAGGMAHDFNNLLTIIMGCGQLVKKGVSGDSRLAESASQILKAAERASALTRQLLAFSRRQVLEAKLFDLGALAGDLEEMLRRLIPENIELETICDGRPHIVMADAGQIEQVIVNLAVNARDAMPAGGKLILKISHLDLAEAGSLGMLEVKPGRYVLLEVSDTGVGMDSEVRERVFEPFFTTKPPNKGTGLGLSTVYGIVKQSGGHVSVYSEPGHGTVFRVYLPRAEGEPYLAEAEAPPEAAGGTETILVAEDEAQVRELVCAVLKENGYRVLEARHGQGALEVDSRHRGPLHLVITDVVMPGMGGPALVERLREAHSDLKVVYMSGYTDSALLRHGIQEQGVGFVQKPFTPDDLVRKVREVLDRRSERRSILIVDDDADVRAALRQMLQSAGWEVAEASDGKEAVKAVRQAKFDLCIVDLVMPEQEGIETIRQLRFDHPELKIVAVSGAFEGSFLRVAKLLGAHAVLGKPLLAETVLGAVREAFGAS